MCEFWNSVKPKRDEQDACQPGLGTKPTTDRTDYTDLGQTGPMTDETLSPNQNGNC
jgi:hypothetical protein